MREMMEQVMQSHIFMKLCLLTALGLLVSRAQLQAQPALERINAIYASLAGDHAALYVAQEMGLFRKYGLDVNLSYTAGAAQVIQTMMAGENQLATAGGSGVVDADFAGADLVAVAGMVNIPAFYIVVQPEIKSLQDLRGKPVGVTRFGSSTDFTMRYILKKAGLEPDKDVPLLQMGGQPELAVGMEARRIFAAPMTPPALQKTLKAGARIQIPPKTIGTQFSSRRHRRAQDLSRRAPPGREEFHRRLFRRRRHAAKRQGGEQESDRQVSPHRLTPKSSKRAGSSASTSSNASPISIPKCSSSSSTSAPKPVPKPRNLNPSSFSTTVW